jgi:hypothetical protein
MAHRSFKPTQGQVEMSSDIAWSVAFIEKSESGLHLIARLTPRGWS